MDKYENMVNKSVGKEKRVKKQYKIKSIKITFLVLALASMVFTTTVLAKSGINNVRDSINFYQIVSEDSALFNQNINRSQDVIWYDNHSNARIIYDNLSEKEIYTEVDLMTEIYKMYYQMRSSSARNELSNMNEVFSYLKSTANENELIKNLPDTFTEYVEQMGFIKKDGASLDTSKYSSKMKEIILSKKSYEKTIEPYQFLEEERGR